MKNPFHRHRWQLVAWDPGYHVQDEAGTKRHFHLSFEKCKCGARRLKTAKKPHEYYDVENHKGAARAKARWETSGDMNASDEADVFDPDYVMVQQGNGINVWKYKPTSGVEKILKLLKNDPEFQTLCEKHSMVDDAFGELETVIKMHENIDTDKTVDK